MELWDGTFPMYARGESEKKSLDIAIGSKIVVTKPDSVSTDRNVRNGDIGKIVHLYKAGNKVSGYLVYNPKWHCRDDGVQRGFGYDGLFIILWRREFEVI